MKMTMSLLFVLVVEDLKPGFSPYKQDIVSAPEIAVWQRSLPSERKHQQWRNQVSAYKGSNILVMGTLHADLGNDLGLVGVS